MARAPYPGLRSYEGADARWFCGRDAEIDILQDHYEEQIFERGRILVYYGPSGAGKSSMVQAGLWPMLRLKEDVARLELLTPTDREDLDGFSQRVQTWVSRQKGGEANRPLMFIDGLDRLFETPIRAGKMNDITAFYLCKFLDFLKDGAREGRFRVIIGIREPWVSYLEAAFQELQWSEKHLSFLQLGYLSPAGIEEFLREPVNRWNDQPGQQCQTVDTAFFENFFMEINSNPASTPLANAMLERAVQGEEKGKSASFLDYSEKGGLVGFIAAHADALWNAWPEELRQRFPIFLEIFQAAVIEEHEGRLRAAVLKPLLADPDTREITTRLIDGRILSTKGHRWEDSVVQVAHDRLLETWDKSASATL